MGIATTRNRMGDGNETAFLHGKLPISPARLASSKHSSVENVDKSASKDSGMKISHKIPLLILRYNTEQG